MARIAAHNVNNAASAHDLAAFTDALDAGADLHGGTFLTQNNRLVESESV
jgi:hypothetical protein